MTIIHHINCGILRSPDHPRIPCHCLLLEDEAGLALVDTGIGLGDAGRLPKALVDMAGFQFEEAENAVRQIEKLGFSPSDVTDIILTHADPDHTGGLADLVQAEVHIGIEEYDALRSGRWRYVPAQFEHRPKWKTYPRSDERWFGLEARPVALGFSSEVLLIPLFGHTLGHCGVAIRQGTRWFLHVGDAYYLRVETVDDDHPVSQIAAQRAEDDALRKASLDEVRRLIREHGADIDLCGYHDSAEFPLTAGD